MKCSSPVFVCGKLNLLNKILLLLTLPISLVFATKIFFMAEQEIVTPKQYEGNRNNTPHFNYQSIGGGPLALETKVQNFPFPNLGEEIIFLRKNTRPDAPLHNLNLHIGLRGGDEPILATLGQKLFLSYVQNHLSPTRASDSPLWIKPYLNELEEPELEVGLDLTSKSGESLIDEVSTFSIGHIHERDAPLKGDSILAQGIRELRQARWWAPDRLFEIYGGEFFGKFVGMERLEFNGQDSPYFLHVKEGDTLIWDNERWQQSDETTPYPMAKLLRVSPYSMGWRIWDREGLEWVEITHSKEESEGIFSSAETTFTQVRKRSASFVSCQVNDKKVTLKKGDWLILTPTGWHLLKTPREVERVVHFELRGELCVFDGVEQMDGKPVFRGTLFDKMRVQMHRVMIPCSRISKGKERGSTSPTKRGTSIRDRLSSPHKQLSQQHTAEEYRQQATTES